jgi:septation ring formation regulator EzrA
MGAEIEDLKGMLDLASRDMGALEEQYSLLKTQLLEVEKDLLKSSTETDNYKDQFKKVWQSPYLDYFRSPKPNLPK